MFSAPVPADRFLQLSSGSTSVTFQDPTGEPTAATGTVTASVYRSDGTLVQASVSTTTGSTGYYAAHLSSASVAQLELLTVKWYDGSTLRKQTAVEIVGGFYFTIAEVRAIDPALSDEDRYPLSRIQQGRALVEWEAERIMGVSWVPRYRYVTLDRPAWPQLLLPDPMIRDIRIVRAYNAPTSTIDYTSGTSFDDLAGTETGIAVSRSGAWSWCSVSAPFRSLTVGYEHGFDAPSPDVKDAALLHLRHKLNRRTAALSDRATSQNNDFGAVTLATAGVDFATGIPDVDSVYARHSYRTPGIG